MDEDKIEDENAEIEASKREAARPMEDMLDEVFSKVLGEDW